MSWCPYCKAGSPRDKYGLHIGVDNKVIGFCKTYLVTP